MTNQCLNLNNVKIQGSAEGRFLNALMSNFFGFWILFDIGALDFGFNLTEEM